MNELTQAIQDLGKNNALDYIQFIANILSIVISAMALFVSVRVPNKIAKQQNSIALFEKRYEVFQFYEKCVAFTNAIKRDQTVEEMQKSCDISFEINCKKTSLNEMLTLLSKFEHTTHQLHFLFPQITDEDAKSLYLALYHLILQIVETDKYVEKDVTGAKENYILESESFRNKYEKVLFSQLEICNIK